jgi:hypothetical protein
MAGSINRQFDFIIDLALHAVSKKRHLELLRSASFNYFAAESINRTCRYLHRVGAKPILRCPEL